MKILFIVALCAFQSVAAYRPQADQLPFSFFVATDQVSTLDSVEKFGRNSDIDTAAPETIWASGGSYAYPDAAETVEIVSDDANDTSAGTGARTVMLYCLDSDWMEITQSATLNGTSAVSLATDCIRYNRMIVTSAGSGGTNAGNLTLRVESGGATRAYIVAGKAQTQLALYTVPGGKTAYLSEWFGSATAGSNGNRLVFELFARPLNQVFQLKHSIAIRVGGSSYFRHKFDWPLKFAAKTDLKIEGTASANNMDAHAGFSILLIND
jgi:hypothetical protein